MAAALTWQSAEPKGEAMARPAPIPSPREHGPAPLDAEGIEDDPLAPRQGDDDEDDDFRDTPATNARQRESKAAMEAADAAGELSAEDEASLAVPAMDTDPVHSVQLGAAARASASRTGSDVSIVSLILMAIVAASISAALVFYLL
jgi:hypothetical protein